MAPRPFDTWPGWLQNTFRSHKDTPITWPVVVEHCMRNGVKDATLITNVVFYLHVWEDHGWGPAAGKPDMEAIWMFFNKAVKKRLKMKDTDFSPKPPLDPTKWRIRYLEDVDCTKLGETKDHRDRLSHLRFLIIDGVAGTNPRQNFDYYNYEWSRVMAINWAAPSKTMHNVQIVRRRHRTNALDWFNAITDGAAVEGAVMESALKTIESNLYWNTKIFISWLIAGPGDADIHGRGGGEKHETVKWMEEIIRIGRWNHHVYYMYHKELSDALENSRKHKKTIF